MRQNISFGVKDNAPTCTNTDISPILFYRLIAYPWIRPAMNEQEAEKYYQEQQEQPEPGA